jgi:hypothetical protein
MERSPLTGLNAQSKTARCSGRRPALDRLALVDVRDDLLDLVGRVAEAPKRRRDRLVDDLEEALADQLLVLDQRDVRLHAGRVAIHHESDRSSRREHGHLGIPVPELRAQFECGVPG